MQFSDLDLTKTYRYVDYLQWPFDDRLELIKRKIFKMTPAPNLYHQDISAIVSSEKLFERKALQSLCCAF